MLALGVALTLAFFFLHASGPLLLVLFLPFWLGTLGIFQGQAST